VVGYRSINQAVAESSSPEGTLEHLFFQIPTTGEYEIWVRQANEDDVSGNQEYAMAWWYGTAPTLVVQGDYNGDSTVDAQDYAVWRGDFGKVVSPGASADGNKNSVIDAADYVVWRKNLVTSGSGIGAAVPEPLSAMLMVTGIAFVAKSRSKRLSRLGW